MSRDRRLRRTGNRRRRRCPAPQLRGSCRSGHAAITAGRCRRPRVAGVGPCAIEFVEILAGTAVVFEFGLETAQLNGAGAPHHAPHLFHLVSIEGLYWRLVFRANRAGISTARRRIGGSVPANPDLLSRTAAPALWSPDRWRSRCAQPHGPGADADRSGLRCRSVRHPNPPEMAGEALAGAVSQTLAKRRMSASEPCCVRRSRKVARVR